MATIMVSPIRRVPGLPLGVIFRNSDRLEEFSCYQRILICLAFPIDNNVGPKYQIGSATGKITGTSTVEEQHTDFQYKRPLYMHF